MGFYPRHDIIGDHIPAGRMLCRRLRDFRHSRQHPDRDQLFWLGERGGDCDASGFKFDWCCSDTNCRQLSCYSPEVYTVMGVPRGSLEERLWRFISPEPNSGCWLWVGAVAGSNTHRYGVMWFPEHKNNTPAHRVSYMLAKGEIPEGYDIDHLCRNTYCVNPDHLEAVTHKENMARGVQFDIGSIQRSITHCPQGHEYTTENTYVCKRGKRYCRSCQRAYWSSEKRRDAYRRRKSR